jgi:hypothetical protein
MHGLQHSIVILAALACAACSGDGAGLDENGRPEPDTGGLTPDLASIQANVFTPICSTCHAGASAPRGLRLDAANSFNMLVGIASSEAPNIQRVKPGDPNNSYLIHKIEGTAAVGARMPLGGPPLPQPTIVVIRQWISQGAQQASPQSVDGALSAAQEKSTFAQGTLVKAEAHDIAVAFDAQIDAALVNETTITLQRKTGESFADVASQALLNPVNAAVVLVTPQSPLPPGDYRLLVRGSSGPVALADISGQPLGRDYEFEFAVEALR